ncbi:amidase [Jatrophihabitans sp.]|jgi:amidase|uniref:amidase n=1 Tax=Jatrophihabitans sp. TaxID=1932789 RepID=UPI002EF7AD66
MRAIETSAAVRRGDLSARAATEQALARIAERDPALGAFRVVRHQRALAEADEVDARPDRATLPLAGVPIAVKDNVAVAGEAMLNGSRGSSQLPQPADHEVVRRLRAAGAVVVGLTNVPELCMFGTTDSSGGITRNPWNTNYSPGGSSGGSAAAVASGMVAVAHGNDGMGSIRIPAACTGLVGIRPGFGMVPAELGSGSWFGMAENGPLATTVADCALLLSVMADRPGLAVLDIDGQPRLRIGVSVNAPLPGLRVERQLRSAAGETAELLAAAGHQVIRAKLRYPSKAGPAAMARWFAGAELDARLLADRSQVDKRIARHALLGRAVLALGGPRPGGQRSMQQAAERYFERVDVLLTPTLAQFPPAATAWSRRGWAANVASNVRYAPFAAPWNLAGWPAMAVPAGVAANGLPLSVQLVGRPGSEATLLALAAHLERLLPWRRLAPGY